jgi:hypothetical protein
MIPECRPVRWIRPAGCGTSIRLLDSRHHFGELRAALGIERDGTTRQECLHLAPLGVANPLDLSRGVNLADNVGIEVSRVRVPVPAWFCVTGAVDYCPRNSLCFRPSSPGIDLRECGRYQITRGLGIKDLWTQPERIGERERLQRAGAWGSMVGWLVSATEVMQLLCAWRAGRPPLRRDSLGGTDGAGRGCIAGRHRGATELPGRTQRLDRPGVA